MAGEANFRMGEPTAKTKVVSKNGELKHVSHGIFTKVQKVMLQDVSILPLDGSIRFSWFLGILLASNLKLYDIRFTRYTIYMVYYNSPRFLKKRVIGEHESKQDSRRHQVTFSSMTFKAWWYGSRLFEFHILAGGMKSHPKRINESRRDMNLNCKASSVAPQTLRRI